MALTTSSSNFSSVTAPSKIAKVCTASSASLGAVIASLAIFAVVTAPSAIFAVVTALEAIFALVTALAFILSAVTALSSSKSSVMASSAIFAVLIPPTGIFADVTAPLAIFAVVTALLASFAVVIAPSCTVVVHSGWSARTRSTCSSDGPPMDEITRMFPSVSKAVMTTSFSNPVAIVTLVSRSVILTSIYDTSGRMFISPNMMVKMSLFTPISRS